MTSLYIFLSVVIFVPIGLRACWRRYIQLKTQDLIDARLHLINSEGFSEDVWKQEKVREITTILSNSKEKNMCKDK
jgi:hypothetical protein